MKPIETPGPTKGSRFTSEYDPRSGRLKQWNECYDELGQVNRVHPKNINSIEIQSPHYPPIKGEL